MVRKKQPLQCVLVEKYTVAPAPSRDYFGIKANISNIYLYRWRISRSHKTKPLMQQIEIEKFATDSSLHDEIEYIFGTEVLSHLLLIAKGISDCFTALPHQILIYICSFLTLRDIGALACTCKKMSKMVMKTDEVWKQLYMKHYPKRKISREEKAEVSYKGWRKFFKKQYIDSKGSSSYKPVSLLESSKVKRTVRPATSQIYDIEKKKNSPQRHVDIRPKTSCVKSKVAKSKSMVKTAAKLTSTIGINNDNKTIVKATSNLTSLQLPTARPKTSNQTTLSLPSTPHPSSSNVLPLTLPSPSSSVTKKTALNSPKAKQPNAKACNEVMKSPRVNNSLKSIPSPRITSKHDFKSSSSSKLHALQSNVLKSPRLLNNPR